MATEQNASQDKLAETRARIAEKHAQLGARLRELCVEDDFAGALSELGRYPKLTTRELTEFERDLRDWGFAYGLAFGLAMDAWPDESHAEIARRAFTPALAVYREWSGEIEDPGVKREKAIREVVRQFEAIDTYQRQEGPIPGELAAALGDLADSARG